jgi:flagellar basal-body rod protein FlgB
MIPTARAHARDLDVLLFASLPLLSNVCAFYAKHARQILPFAENWLACGAFSQGTNLAVFKTDRVGDATNAAGCTMIDSLLSSPTIRMLEQTMSFTEQRHQVLVEDIANIDTPGFVQRDLSVSQFQKTLREAVKRNRESFNDAFAPESTDTLAFDPDGPGVQAVAQEKPVGVPFHDRGVRSMEYLMSEMADNALAHNIAAQLLKGRYDQLARAISMKV